MIKKGRPEYEATVGVTARFQQEYDGKQPGDPAKGAAVVMQVADMEETPVKIIIGK